MFEQLDKHIKYLPIYGGIVYVIGFLILSTRLAFLNIYIKDFLTLDYIKTGIIFLFITVPLALIWFQVIKLKLKSVFRILLALFAGALWIAMIRPVMFEYIIESKPMYYLSYLVYPSLVYLVISISGNIEKKVKEKDIFDLASIVVFGLVLITVFSNFIFPQIKFRYGGGAPYTKILYVKNQSNTIEEVTAKVYYENSEWIHFMDTGEKILSIPKERIFQEESTAEKDFFKNMFK